MSDMKLPIKLKKEPLIDAVFEIRFTSDVPVSDVLTGILYSKLEGQKSINKLSAHEIPARIRQNDPNLQFAPLVRIQLENYHVAIGDKNVVVSCNMPYQGWGVFKPNITNILMIIKETGIVKEVQRYSMKYVDLIEGKTPKERFDLLKSTISIGQYNLEDQTFSLRVEIVHENFLNIVSISSSGKVISSNVAEREGVIVDTDTIFNIQEKTTFNDWYEEHENRLEDIHTENKRMFFNSLKDETIQSLEPEYE